MKQKFLKQNKGITLLEALIGVGLVVILSTSIYAAITGAALTMSDAKQRTGAIALANEQMEVLRHLVYEKVGTISNALGPDGPISPDEVVKRNGFSYHILTDIRYKDDSYDGLGSEDTVNTNTDYKIARVTVIWQNKGKEKNVQFTSTFIPRGLETNVGGGTLSINVINSLGEIVPYFKARIVSVDNSPATDVTVESDDTGNLTFPGTSAQTYRIYLSKSGYENVRTYPNPPSSAFTPINRDLIVQEGQVTMNTYTMDRSGNLTLNAVNVADASGINGISFHLQGGRQIGTHPDTFSMDVTESTSDGGKLIKSTLSPGSYNVVNVSELSNDNYYFLNCDTNLPIQLASDENKEVNFLFADKGVNSLVVRALNSADSTPIYNAQVHVTGTDFDQTVNTDNNGIAYFPPKLDPAITMPEGDYHFEITATGFGSQNKDVTINDLNVEEISLTAE